MKLTIQPLRAEGRVLIPTYLPLGIASNACTVQQALREKGYLQHVESANLINHISADRSAFCVAICSGPTLYGVWLGWEEVCAGKGSPSKTLTERYPWVQSWAATPRTGGAS